MYACKIDYIRHYVNQFMKQIYSNYLLPTSVSLWSPEALWIVKFHFPKHTTLASTKSATTGHFLNPHVILSLEISTQAINTHSGRHNFFHSSLTVLSDCINTPQQHWLRLFLAQHVFTKQCLVQNRVTDRLQHVVPPSFRRDTWRIVRHIQYTLEDNF